MKTVSTINEARSTCEGLHRLVRQLNGAVGDIEKKGASTYEVMALLATANECIQNLSVQLEALDETNNLSNITALHSPAEDNEVTLRAANGG